MGTACKFGKKGKAMRELTASEVDFTMTYEQDDIPVRGNAMVSGDDDFDKQCEDEIIASLENGDTHSWCCITVTAQYKRFSGSSHLGGVNVTEASDVEFVAREHGMYDDALEALNDLIAATENEIPR